MTNTKTESASIPRQVILGSILLTVIGAGMLMQYEAEEGAVLEEEESTVTGENTMPVLAAARVSAKPAVAADPPVLAAGNTYLDDLQEKSAKVGWGKLGKHGSMGYEGLHVKLGGQSYNHALSMHPSYASTVSAAASAGICTSEHFLDLGIRRV